jgi:type IV pilus assembly protein PilX
MLANRTLSGRRSASGGRQRGVVMLMALIVLVVMTLAGIALMRSMDTSNLIAGNMAFKQAATQASDIGVESAITWLQTANAAGGLDNDIAAQGYLSKSLNNADKTYALPDLWKNLEQSGVCHLTAGGGGCINAPETNANGNQVSYAVQRLCAIPNKAANTAGCAVVAGAVVSSGNNEGAGEETLSGGFLTVYYRIIVRVLGPRNAVSYVQTIVSL